MLINSQSGYRNSGRVFAGLISLFVLFLILDLFLGSVYLSPAEIIKAVFKETGSVSETILMQFRLPKALTALLAGIALSVSGLKMQTLFRNPIAGPYVLGLSSGASLGVAFVILGFSSQISADGISRLDAWSLAVASWLGAGFIMILMMAVASRVKNIMTVLILGIMLSGAISSLVSIMQYFSTETMLKSYVIWTMGSLGNLTSSQLTVLAISVSAGTLISLASVKMMNALLLGEEYALSIGLNVKLSRYLIIGGTSILAGTVTAFCGPIGFIGIAVPHLARMLFSTADHKILIPGTILTGAIIMLAADMISQLPGTDSTLPINSVTALLGIPVVIWVIFKNQKSREIF